MTPLRPGSRPATAGARGASRNRPAAPPLALLALLLLPVAPAQAPHGLEVRVPDHLGIRIVRSDGAPTARARVVFDYASAPDAYVAVVATGGGELEPTSVTDFADVQVAASRGRWAVQVRAVPFGYAGDGSGAGLALADIRVQAGATSGLAPGSRQIKRQAGWSLGAAYRLVATGSGNTRGWTGLGFNGHDYRLAVQGDEGPGDHATVVTYTLLNP